MANSVDLGPAVCGMYSSTRSRLPVFTNMYATDRRLPFFKSIVSNSEWSISFQSNTPTAVSRTPDVPTSELTRINSFSQLMQDINDIQSIHDAPMQTEHNNELTKLQKREEEHNNTQQSFDQQLNQNILGVVSSDDEISVLSDISMSYSEKEFYSQYKLSKSVCSNTTDAVPSSVTVDADHHHLAVSANSLFKTS